MRYLGLDLGSRTLGVAISDKLGLIASNDQVIRHNEEYDRLVEEVKKIVAEKEIGAIVLGYPKNMDNSVGEKGKLSEAFKEKLEQVLDIPIYLCDERLTTVEAHKILLQNDTSRKKRKQVVDKIAAAIILQSFLDKKGR